MTKENEQSNTLYSVENPLHEYDLEVSDIDVC